MSARPFPDDPQWLQLDRKLPPDAVLERLLRVGFRPTDIAAAFQVNYQAMWKAMRRLNMPPIQPNPIRHRRNMARPTCVWIVRAA